MKFPLITSLGSLSQSIRIFLVLFGILLAVASSAMGTANCVRADDTTEAVDVLRSVQPGGVNSAAARKAVQHLVNEGTKALLPLLKGFRDASPLADNWLRNAFEQIVAGEEKAGRTLPQSELEAFVQDQSESPSARRLVYETLRRSDPAIEDRLIPGMLQDASSEFRRDAVARLIREAGEASDSSVAATLHQKAFEGAVHEDQVKTIAEFLRKQGHEVDIQRHFGFLPEWKIVGPFDNKEEKGFAVAYAPELELKDAGEPNLQGEYDGQVGKVVWSSISTNDDFGVIDIAKQIENYKGSVMYAATAWNSAREQHVEIRLGTPNSWKLWLNGKLVFEREEYHRSSQMDQYRVPVTLQAGRNTLMLKIGQNEQTQDWAQRYQFQVRLCTSTGAAIQQATNTARQESKSGVQ